MLQCGNKISGFQLLLLFFAMCFGFGWIFWEMLGSKAWDIIIFLAIMFILSCLGSIDWGALVNAKKKKK